MWKSCIALRDQMKAGPLRAGLVYSVFEFFADGSAWMFGKGREGTFLFMAFMSIAVYVIFQPMSAWPGKQGEFYDRNV